VGPGMSGKTTNLRHIYEHTPDSHRDQLVSLKAETDRTLFFDFLPLLIGDVNGYQARLHIYTIPGQELYEANKRVILKGVDGIVFVADSDSKRLEDNRRSMEGLIKSLEFYNYDILKIPFVIQYNKRDLVDAAPIEDLSVMLNENGVPEFEASATNGHGAIETLQYISAKVIEQVRN